MDNSDCYNPFDYIRSDILPGGAVVAQGSQQPDRRKTGSDVSVKPERKDTGPKVGKEVKRLEKKKSR